MRDNKNNNKVQSRLDEFFYDIPRIHPATYIKETLDEGLSSENLASIYESANVNVKDQQQGISSEHESLLGLINTRLLHEDCGFRNKIQLFIDEEEIGLDDEDYKGYEELKRQDAFILDVLKEDLEEAYCSSSREYYRLSRLIQEEIDKVGFDSDKEFEDYKYLSYQISMLLFNRLSYKDFGLTDKIQKLLDKKKLSKKDRNYEGHKQFELLDNYILERVKKGLSYQQRGIRDVIEEVVSTGYTRITDIYDYSQLFENGVIKSVIGKIVQEDNVHKQEFLLGIIKEYRENNEDFDEDKVTEKLTPPEIREVSSRDKAILAVLIYSLYNDVKSFDKMSENCKSDKYYKYLAEDNIFSADVLEDFIINNTDLILIVYDLFLQKVLGHGDYKCGSILMDGIVIQMDKSFVITRKDVEKLLNLLPKKITRTDLEQLTDEISVATHYILTSNIMSQDDKIRYTKFLQNELISSNKEEMLLDRQDVYWLLVKRKDKYICSSKDLENIQCDFYQFEPFDNLKLKPFMKYYMNTDKQVFMIMDKVAYLESLALDYVEELIRYRSPYRLQETDSFIDYLDGDLYNNGMVYDFITDAYFTRDGVIPLTDVLFEDSESDEYFGIIKKFYDLNDNSDDQQYSLYKEVVNYGTSVKVDEVHITQYEADQIEGKINLMLIAYNIKRRFDFIDNVEYDKYQDLSNFLLQLNEEFPYTRFSVDLA